MKTEGLCVISVSLCLYNFREVNLLIPYPKDKSKQNEKFVVPVKDRSSQLTQNSWW